MAHEILSDTTIKGALSVTDTTTATGAITANGGVSATSLSASTTLGVTGATTLSNTLGVTGLASFTTAGIALPSGQDVIRTGTTANRPGAPYTGQLYSNTTTGYLERWSGSAWLNIAFTSSYGIIPSNMSNDKTNPSVNPVLTVGLVRDCTTLSIDYQAASAVTINVNLYKIGYNGASFTTLITSTLSATTQMKNNTYVGLSLPAGFNYSYQISSYGVATSLYGTMY